MRKLWNKLTSWLRRNSVTEFLSRPRTVRNATGLMAAEAAVGVGTTVAILSVLLAAGNHFVAAFVVAGFVFSMIIKLTVGSQAWRSTSPNYRAVV